MLTGIWYEHAVDRLGAAPAPPVDDPGAGLTPEDLVALQDLLRDATGSACRTPAAGPAAAGRPVGPRGARRPEGALRPVRSRGWAARLPRWAAPTAVVLVALAARLVAETRAYDLFIDEITYATVARNLATGAGLTLYGHPFVLHPASVLALYALVVRLAGLGGAPTAHLVLALRPVSAVAGALACGGLYALVTPAAGRRAGIAAAAVLALDPFTVGSDSLVMLEAVVGVAAFTAMACTARSASMGPGRRRSWTVAAAGLAAGVVVTGKDTFGLVLAVTVAAMAVTGWVVPRRRALAIAAVAVACYGAYLVALAATGDLGAWWSTQVGALLRLVGADQLTGFNSPHVHVSLLSRVLADAGDFAPSYLLLAAGVVAAAVLLRRLAPWRADWARRATPCARAATAVALWALAAAAYLAYATVFGSIESQMYYILLGPGLAAAAVVLAGPVPGARSPGPRPAGPDGHTAPAPAPAKETAPPGTGTAPAPGGRRRWARRLVVVVLAVDALVWVRVHGTSADDYTRFLRWEQGHVPAGSTLSLTDGLAQFLVRDAVIGDWDTERELVAHRVDDVLVSRPLVVQGYTASLPFLHLLQTRGRLVWSSGGPTQLELFDVRALTGAGPPQGP